ncbi:hypothetical protein VTJ49DRAFT_3041 [Mycothermus thermophilus]|uniref:DUF8021 domain-containing protein n=1 Tax=Humicola insolens TaxID=85995 RepID=A0ABR3VEF9_HUMIN
MAISTRLHVLGTMLGSAVQHALGHPLVLSAPACDRSTLARAADAYIAAQAAGGVGLLVDIVADGWEYEENIVRKDVRSGVLSKSLKIDHRRTIYDLVACATYTEVIGADPADPYVIGTQIRHDEDSLATLIDSIATTTNSWLFNAQRTLEYVLQETWDPIPKDRRDSREFIKAASDAYLDMWSNDTAADAVPWRTPCARLEGGVYTGRGRPDDSCKAGIPTNTSQAPNIRRRHEFRLEGGKLRVELVWILTYAYGLE